MLLDLSASNPSSTTHVVLGRVADDVGKRLAALKIGDRIAIVSFGEYDARKNILQQRDLIIYALASCDTFVIVGLLGDNPAHTIQLGKAWMKWCHVSGFRPLRLRRVATGDSTVTRAERGVEKQIVAVASPRNQYFQ
jgi:hypothetical protein